MVSLDKLALAVIVFLVFIFAGVGIIKDVNDNYGSEGVDMGIDTYINDTYELATNNPIEEEYNQTANTESYLFAENMQNQLLTGSSVTEQDTENSMFKSVFSVLRTITAPVNLIKKVIEQVGNVFGIPGIYITYAFAALIISVMFAIAYLIFRVRS